MEEPKYPHPREHCLTLRTWAHGFQGPRGGTFSAVSRAPRAAWTPRLSPVWVLQESRRTRELRGGLGAEACTGTRRTSLCSPLPLHWRQKPAGLCHYCRCFEWLLTYILGIKLTSGSLFEIFCTWISCDQLVHMVGYCLEVWIGELC